MASEYKLPTTLEGQLKDMQKLLANPDFGLDDSPQARSVIMMFEFILKKMIQMQKEIKALKAKK